MPGSAAGGQVALSLGGIAVTAVVLVFWISRGRIRSQQQEACQAITRDSPARWEKISTAAAPQLKELEALSREVVTAIGESTGWRITSEAEPGGSGLPRYLGRDLDTLRLNYLSLAARYFAEHPRQRWRDDAARVRLTLDATRRGLEKGNRRFRLRRSTTGRRWPSAAKRKLP